MALPLSLRYLATCLVLCGCHAGEQEAPPVDGARESLRRAPDLSGMTVVLEDTDEGVRYSLDPAGVQLLQRLLRREPDSVSPVAIPVYPSWTIEIAGTRYQVEPDELIDLGMPGAVWDQEGLRESLMSGATPQ